MKVAACLEGMHGYLSEGGTGEAGEAGAARRAVSCVCKTGGGFMFEQLPLRDGRQLLHCLFDLTHTHSLCIFHQRCSDSIETCHALRSSRRGNVATVYRLAKAVART